MVPPVDGRLIMQLRFVKIYPQDTRLHYLRPSCCITLAAETEAGPGHGFPKSTPDFPKRQSV